IEPVARSHTMNSLRLFALTAICAVLATPVASVAAPAESSVACLTPRLTLVERRVSEEAARGLPTLISFLNRTQPIYQVRLDGARACALDPSVGADDRVGERLRGVRVLVEEALLRVEAGRGHRPAEDAVGLGDDAGVRDDLQIARAGEQRDHRVEVGDGVDLP